MKDDFFVLNCTSETLCIFVWDDNHCTRSLSLVLLESTQSGSPHILPLHNDSCSCICSQGDNAHRVMEQLEEQALPPPLWC